MSEQISNINLEEMFNIQKEACIAHEALCNSFDWNGAYIYPEDFAGAYIDYDTLHVLISQNGDMDKYKQLLSDFTKISYDYVKYSYHNLFTTVEAIIFEKSLSSEIVAYGVDVVTNKAFIQTLP